MYPRIEQIRFDTGYSHAATGMVAMTSHGEFLLAPNPLTAETLASRDSITEAVKEGWYHSMSILKQIVKFWLACGSLGRKKDRSEVMGLLSQIDEFGLCFSDL